MRRVWPHAFLLQSSILSEPIQAGRLSAVPPQYLDEAQGALGAGRTPLPVALRWLTEPLLGFPRQPFEVFRRESRYELQRELLRGQLPVEGRVTLEWDGSEMYVVAFVGSPSPGTSLEIRPLDVRGDPIPNQHLALLAPGPGQVRTPGIAALRVEGKGTLANVRGEEQVGYANLEDWQRIERVGLPFAAGEVLPPVYSGDALQGLEAHPLDGLEAARLRLRVAQALALPPPDSGDPQIEVPIWPDLDVDGLLLQLRGSGPTPLQLIRACLENSDDSSLASPQVSYRHIQSEKGIRQADDPPSPIDRDPATFEVPVVGVTQLAVAHDSEFATALGYGTANFPPLFVQTGTTLGRVAVGFDYMVTARFNLPFRSDVEVAALATLRSPPTPAGGVRANSLQSNRPPQRDLPSSEAVQLGWSLSPQPQGYFVLKGTQPGPAQVLNASRLAIPGWDPFVPQRPEPVEGETPNEARTLFTDPVSPLPLDGLQQTRYLVAARDVFGRWSSWVQAVYAAAAPPVTMPGLHSAKLETDLAAAVGQTVPARLEIEFSWDWSDRSLDRVVFTGLFLPTSSAPPASHTNGLRLSASADGSPDLVVSFDGPEKPRIASGQTGEARLLSRDPPDPERPIYRLMVEGLSCDFSTAKQVTYAVYARGAEAVRPARLSDIAGPRLARAFDPIPASPPPLPVDLLWTALPDADGRARAVLNWPASPRAAGYFVWEATEAALRAAVDAGLAPPEPGTSLFTRATQLHDLLISPQAQARSLFAFTRLNERQLKSTTFEVALPAASDTLYAYRISTINSAGVESERSSDFFLVAVPRRVTPGQPRLLLRRQGGPLADQVQIIALCGVGPQPAGYRAFRVRSEVSLSEIGLMGPALFTESDPGWSAHLEPALDGGVAGEGQAISDNVDPSWFAYHYRVVAIGPDSPATGLFAGESLASGAQSIVVPPFDPPLLSEVNLNPPPPIAASNRVLSFKTDLPVRRSPLAAAQIRLSRIRVSAEGDVARETVLAAESHSVEAGNPLQVLPLPSRIQLEALPQISRGDPDAQGQVSWTVRLPGAIDAVVITLTDPLGRVSEAFFPEVR